MANLFERMLGENDFRQHIIRRSSNNYKTTDFSSLLNIILHFLIHTKTVVWSNIHVVLTSDTKQVCKIKTKQNNKNKCKKQAETQIKASYSTAHEKQNKHLIVACGTYFYPLLIPLPILLLAQRSLCWGENLRGSLHLTRGKWSLGTNDLSY